MRGGGVLPSVAGADDEAIQPEKAFTQAQRGALSRLLRSAMCRSLAMTGGLNP
ncbi:MAG: hypothetical protein LBT00_09795 [Spirochaetaceae bacterium]|nr:hypothetical protein [Spirochaetaceae bacterium]